MECECGADLELVTCPGCDGEGAEADVNWVCAKCEGAGKIWVCFDCDAEELVYA